MPIRIGILANRVQLNWCLELNTIDAQSRTLGYPWRMTGKSTSNNFGVTLPTDGAPVLYLLGGDGTLRWMSDNLSDFSGVDPMQLLGQPLSSLVRFDEDDVRLFQVLEQTLDGTNLDGDRAGSGAGTFSKNGGRSSQSAQCGHDRATP